MDIDSTINKMQSCSISPQYVNINTPPYTQDQNSIQTLLEEVAEKLKSLSPQKKKPKTPQLKRLNSCPLEKQKILKADGSDNSLKQAKISSQLNRIFSNTDHTSAIRKDLSIIEP